jgi:hypothetical protein
MRDCARHLSTATFTKLKHCLGFKPKPSHVNDWRWAHGNRFGFGMIVLLAAASYEIANNCHGSWLNRWVVKPGWRHLKLNTRSGQSLGDPSGSDGPVCRVKAFAYAARTYSWYRSLLCGVASAYFLNLPWSQGRPVPLRALRHPVCSSGPIHHGRPVLPG